MFESTGVGIVGVRGAGRMGVVREWRKGWYERGARVGTSVKREAHALIAIAVVVARRDLGVVEFAGELR